MTPEELVSKIFWIIGPHPERLYYTPSEKKKDVISLIKENEKEILKEFKNACNEAENEGVRKGRASMREEVAKVIENGKFSLSTEKRFSRTWVSKDLGPLLAACIRAISIIPVEGK